MAFIVHDGKLCRDMWPKYLARFPNDLDEPSTLPKSRLLPSAYEDLCERVAVVGNLNRGVDVLAIHPEQNPGEAPGLCVRLQGIVGQVSLTPRGNWNGDVDDAVKATQSLILIDLHPGCEDSAFARQREAMHDLEELILAQVHGRRGDEKPARVARNGAINLRKRAFAMPKPGVTGITSTNADDPDGKVRRMAHLWLVDHRIMTSVPNSKGRVSMVPPPAIRTGDMVDVAVSVEVVRRRGPGGGYMIEVMFCPLHVVRLKTVGELRAAITSPNVNHSPPSTDPTRSMRRVV
ncbi:hypothetical protein LXA43DRAFT_1183516 [Ganoderma leucocontextum]|nr:hypothetical protein LXA43DRAFT_1183516 [Ganoderma leucocontextum]